MSRSALTVLLFLVALQVSTVVALQRERRTLDAPERGTDSLTSADYARGLLEGLEEDAPGLGVTPGQARRLVEVYPVLQAALLRPFGGGTEAADLLGPILTARQVRHLRAAPWQQENRAVDMERLLASLELRLRTRAAEAR